MEPVSQQVTLIGRKWEADTLLAAIVRANIYRPVLRLNLFHVIFMEELKGAVLSGHVHLLCLGLPTQLRHQFQGL